MADFLTGPALTEAVIQITQTGKAKLAVAFWGSDACKLLKLPDDCTGLQAICDAFSGACNPEALQDLMSRKAEIRYIEGLHAKVYLGGSSFVIGSANASANGLGQESIEIDEHLEAGFIVTDTRQVAKCEIWFQALFERAFTLQVQDLARIRQLWIKRRNARPNPNPTQKLDLGEMLSQYPQFLQDRRFFLYSYKDSSLAEEVKKVYYKSRFNNLTPKEDGGYHPFYYGTGSWDVVEGDVIMDFAFGRSKIHFTGFWEVRGRIKKHEIIAVRLIEKPLGIEVRKADWKRFREAAQKSYDRGRLPLNRLIAGVGISEILAM